MDDENTNILVRFQRAVTNMLDGPVVFVRENIVKKNQQSYPWYHEKFRRVPTFDECDVDDLACYFEANQQFLRDKLVDDEILSILRHRYEECALEHMENKTVCNSLYDTYNDASTAWYLKYGDLGVGLNVRSAYMKQKHRMVWERRHGPIGSGMNEAYRDL